MGLPGAEAWACAADIRSRSRNSAGPDSALASSPTRYRGAPPVPAPASPETQAVRATFRGLRGAVKACASASRVAFAAPRFGDTAKTWETSTPVSSSAPPPPPGSGAHEQARAATTPSTLGPRLFFRPASAPRRPPQAAASARPATTTAAAARARDRRARPAIPPRPSAPRPAAVARRELLPRRPSEAPRPPSAPGLLSAAIHTASPPLQRPSENLMRPSLGKIPGPRKKRHRRSS